MLIERVAAWAAPRRADQLRLMVTCVNEGAIRFYQRLGFEMTGRSGPYPNDPALVEFEMARPVISGR